ncbi:hypothetical protein [Candidatus Nitrospira neomarina]|uniref:Uncharacterized protein n=1 Tax=Candidatus Nitrospira neomarina TaxID=3020899 RepID=A0AA96K3X4_9BACT|nr:hypothetical protein [Candidatus Nitrospira neomarina]WNM62939.1 hypothetical protein PQG83_04090 [Candidatus Nitrospira neomarina]
MLKILVLQSLSYLTDDQTEDQICHGSAAIVLSVTFWKHSYSIPRVVGPMRTGRSKSEDP